MSFKRLVIICSLSTLLAGCSTFYGSQPPAPVYGSQPKSQKPSAATQNRSKSHSASSKETVKTQPLKEFSIIHPEAIPFSDVPPVQSTPQQPAAVTHDQPLLLSSPPPPPELAAFEPMEATAPLSPAVSALVLAANQNSRSGDLELAASSLERAIRIEPRNANLFYKLALLRLKQEKPRLAEDLAKKSALLAANDNKLKKHCWLLIAHIRETQQNFAGAKEARNKSDSF
jgi:tetratricopeptide (TPR) repeat protein